VNIAQLIQMVLAQEQAGMFFWNISANYAFLKQTCLTG
jgi:hypothetical protein